LWYVEISDNIASQEDEPNLLYISTMHGDEVVGKELMIYLIRKLTAEYGQTDRVTNLVNNARIFIMPLMNPDGNASGSRFNAQGVDLNRDFPDFTSDPTDSEQGRAPETRAIMQLHSRHHFASALNFHGGTICFNLPWDTRSNGSASVRFQDDILLKHMGREYADANPSMRSNNSFDRGLTYGYEWYEVDGGMQDWSIHYRQSMHATIELSYNKWPSDSTLGNYWRENTESVVRYLERGLQGAHLEVVDSSGNRVANVAVTSPSSPRSITYAGGVVHRPLLSGDHVLEISAPGFETQQINHASQVFDGSLERVTLNRP
jgi:carboxypeptidase D